MNNRVTVKLGAGRQESRFWDQVVQCAYRQGAWVVLEGPTEKVYVNGYSCTGEATYVAIVHQAWAKVMAGGKKY